MITPKRLSTRDAQGRRWKVRTRRYQVGWIWEAALAEDGIGRGSPPEKYFPAGRRHGADAHRVITQSNVDDVAEMQTYISRLAERGTECKFTAADHKAIARAGQKK